MLISKKSLYAIRALLELVGDVGQKPVNSAEIAKRQGVSGRFIEIILNELKNAGIVESRRGANGGYLMTKEPSNISVLDVLSCIDGPVSIINETKEDRLADYFGVNALCNLWTETKKNIVVGFKNMTIKDLFEKENSIRNKEVCNYNI